MDKPYFLVFPDRLKAARKLRGLEQNELAASAELPCSSISKYENGERSPSLANLIALGVALDIPLDYLCGLSGEITSTRQKDEVSKVMDQLTFANQRMVIEIAKTVFLNQPEKVNYQVAQCNPTH